jgi:hypothetical protein
MNILSAIARVRWTRAVSGGLAIAAAALGAPVNAEDFALSVSPPRFELATKPGETVRAVVELANASNIASDLRFATAEWDLGADGSLSTSNVLKPGSCRPWVAIERRQIALAARAQLRFRFEIAPPADTPPVECRFAIVIAGADEQVSAAKNVSFPVSAQIALIVYVAVGDVKPQLRIVKADVVTINGVATPALMVENTGTAHGRLSAFLKGTDANGTKREFIPATLPILPGETRQIVLSVDDGADAIETANRPAPARAEPDVIRYPLQISGTINDTVSSYKFDGTFAP